MVDEKKKVLNDATLITILTKIKSWILSTIVEEITSRIPSKLPSPNAITFTGGSTATYDGSAAVTVNIPTAANVTVEGNTLSFGNVKIGVD